MPRGATSIPTFRPHRLAMGYAVTPALNVLYLIHRGLSIARVVPVFAGIFGIVRKYLKECPRFNSRRRKLLLKNIRPNTKRQRCHDTVRRWLQRKANALRVTQHALDLFEGLALKFMLAKRVVIPSEGIG